MGEPMASDVAIKILGFIRVRTWCRYKDILETFSKQDGNLTISENTVIEALGDLMSWKLIQAVDKQNRAIKKSQLVPGLPSTTKFSLSPQAVDIEDSLGITFGAKPHSIFGAPVVSQDFPDVFVLMPFASKFDPVNAAIVQTVTEANMTCARADKFTQPHSIVADIWSAINHAKIIIADCTGKNPNVFYEIGIAHALGKKAILLAQSDKDIPFDLKTIRFVIYSLKSDSMIKEFRGKLLRMLKTKK
jgi:hypothetical protein